jgi:hypothetical protein
LSAPDRDPAEVYEKERREIRKKDDGESLKIRAIGTDYQKGLAEEELQHREYALNVRPDRRVARRALGVSIIAIVVSIIAIVLSAR